MTPAEFVKKWRGSTRTERSASQEHFLDLCRVVGHPTPGEMDPSGEFFTFEKGAAILGGGHGWADVWKRGHFAWEYKGPGRNLEAALRQVLAYHSDLENPPLLVVCDLNVFEVHTKFTNSVTQRYIFDLDALEANALTPRCPLPPLQVLDFVFHQPERLRPVQTPAGVTSEAAKEFATLAASLQRRGHDPQHAAHFLMRLLFCLFSEDIGLLPDRLFTRLVENARFEPARFQRRVSGLFSAMATGGDFGEHEIRHFNGGLFADAEALELTSQDIEVLHGACRLDWSSVEPAIFGTLFERSLDPAKRSQLGAQYTSREDIELIVEPVLMAPLRRRWEEVQEQARAIQVRHAAMARPAARTRAALTPEGRALATLLTGFQDELTSTRVLDPACGSGNFLYVALNHLLNLEHEVSRFASRCGLPMLQSRVGPEQLYGIEIDAYAYELAQIVVWIGYIQWLKDNILGEPSSPILKPLDTIQHRDAILEVGEDGTITEPAWPDADVIIGNPPFIGGNRIRQRLGDQYVERLFTLYEGRIPAFADLVCYWFERTREQVLMKPGRRAGLLATQAIRGGVNRQVLERIRRDGSIFWAMSDRDWVLDGVMVHVSMVGFDDGTEQKRVLNGVPVRDIYANLSSGVDVTVSRSLSENLGISFQGPSAKSPMDIDGDLARKFIEEPVNINGRTNADVIRPVYSAIDITGRWRDKWTIDFGLMTLEAAAEYEAPFEYVRRVVYPIRSQNRRTAYAQRWWQYAEPRPGMRRALADLRRYIATPCHAKHRVFVWVPSETLCNQANIVFARDDDYFFGVLHSSAHEMWARARGTQVREAESGFRYTPTSTFETFPFPWAPGHEPVGDPLLAGIAEAARELHVKREAWLNPPGASAADLAKRSLTNLYNEPRAWLQIAHEKLDAAVLAAYGWPTTLTSDELLERLLALNLSRQAV